MKRLTIKYVIITKVIKMAISNFTLTRIFNEYKKRLEGARISKIIKISQFDYSFLLFAKSQESLIISLEPLNPYILLSESYYKMLDDGGGFVNSLKKYFDGGHIISLEKIQNDRVIIFTIKKITQTYQTIQNKLILELLPHNTNAVIVDENNIIIDTIKKTTLDDKRPLFKGLKYTFEESNDKSITMNDTLETLKNKIGRVPYEDICHRVDLGENIKDIIDEILTSKHYYVYKNDILSIPLKFKECKQISLKELPSIYEKRNQEKFMKEHYYTAFHLVNQKLKGLRNKLVNLDKDLKRNELRNDYIEIGNLLFMYQDQYVKGMKEIEIEGRKIILDEKLNLIENANKYFKLYRKSKVALEQLEIQKRITKEKIDYFEKIQNQINYAVIDDMDDILQELRNDGYLKDAAKKPKNNKKKNIEKVYSPHILYSKDNCKIGFGLSSFQNDYLTFSLARKDDYFLHIKDSHGPHVIIFDNNPSKETIQFAAEIALFFASKEAGDIYICDKKDVKKVPGKLGLVTLNNESIITLNSISEETKTILINSLKKQ